LFLVKWETIYTLFKFQLSLEKEEQERQELRKLLMGSSGENHDGKGDGKKRDGNGRKDNTAGEDDQSMQNFASQPGTKNPGSYISKLIFLCQVVF